MKLHMRKLDPTKLSLDVKHDAIATDRTYRLEKAQTAWRPTRKPSCIGVGAASASPLRSTWNECTKGLKTPGAASRLRALGSMQGAPQAEDQGAGGQRGRVGLRRDKAEIDLRIVDLAGVAGVGAARRARR